MRHFAVQTHCNNGLDDSACVELRLFDVWNGYLVGPKPSARTFLLLRLCFILAVLLAFDAVWGRKLTLIMHVLSKYAAITLVILRWSSFPNWWRIGTEQTDRTFVLIAACVCAWTRTRKWFSMQYELLISPYSWPWCPNTLQWRWRLCVDICLLNVWNVCRIGGWPWLSSAYVCIAVCAFGMFG